MLNRRSFLRSAVLQFWVVIVTVAPISVVDLGAQVPTEVGHWVATWGTAQELYRHEDANQPRRDGRPQLTISNQTVRMVVKTSIGGDRVRLRVANAFGAPTVVIGAATVARRASGSAIVPGSAKEVTFGGERSLVLHPGVVAYSDPVDFEAAPLEDLVVSLYLQGDAGRPTTHPLGLHTTYISGPGDFTAATDFPADTTTQSYYWLAGIDVFAPEDAFAIVALGNSITDGALSTPDADRSWPSRLAARLAANEDTRNIGVVNAGISGNRVLSDGAGVSVLARLENDALSYSGVKWIVLLEGINDIGAITRGPTNPAVTAERLIWAYRQVIERAHARGVRVAGATLTPYEGAGYFSKEGEEIRAAVNDWIRDSGEFDAVIDFDAATRNPESPTWFLPAYDPGDHLHPNDAGYQRMADEVDTSIFAPAGVGQ